MPNETSTQERSAPNSRYRTRWGSELAAHEGNPDFVLSLARGLRVLETFEAHPDGLSIAEIARLTALSRAAVRRLLITLELLGYIEVDNRRYRLSRRLPFSQWARSS
jgi:IclR family transcriptional regulator, pca regulon regulatory protein